MIVKPAEGRAVRDPSNMTLLRPEGREVPRNSFWLRRLRDGDVVLVEAPPPGRVVTKKEG